MKKLASLLSENLQPTLRQTSQGFMTMPPAMVDTMSPEAYLNHAAVDYSTIKAMIDGSWTNKEPESPKHEPTPATDFDTLTRMMILDSTSFFNTISYVPAHIKPGTAAFKEYKSPSDHLGHKFYIPEEQNEKLRNINRRVRNHNEAAEMLLDGTADVSCFWVDASHSVMCKARCDYISKHNCIVSLKTTDKGVDSASFSKLITADRSAYAIQAAHYMHFAQTTISGDSEMVRSPPVNFVWVLVQTKPPYDVAVFRATKEVLDYGHAWRNKGIKAYKDVQQSDTLPNRVLGIHDAEMPAWARVPTN